MEGDEISISQRKCRRHYGNAVQTAFITGKHLECDAFNDEFTGEKRASNQMSWLLHKGQNLSTTESCHGRLLLHRKFWPGKARVSSLQLRAADCNKAPKRSVDSVSEFFILLAIFC